MCHPAVPLKRHFDFQVRDAVPRADRSLRDANARNFRVKKKKENLTQVGADILASVGGRTRVEL